VLPRLLRVCVGAQRYRAAVEYARPYLERDPDTWPLRFLVASIHIGLGEPRSAQRHLELLLVHNPRHAEAHFTLAQLLRDDLHDPAQADVHFREYLALEPEGTHASEARDGLLTPLRSQ
jgi:predicted Zn-dependent protease